MNWQLTTTLVSLVLGFVGTVFGCWSFFWTRKHRLLDSLSGILREYVSCLRQLTNANNARRSAESLRFSFPDGGTHGNASRKADELIKQYNSLMAKAHEACEKTEIEISANVLKFPNAIKNELTFARDDLFQFGRLVNRGLWDAADVQAGRVKDRYKMILRLARGWRLRNPFRAMIGASEEKGVNIIKEQTVDSQTDFIISEERMNVITELVHKRMTSEKHRRFVIHPPQEIIDNPKLLKGEINVDVLRNLMFKIAFQDGEVQTLAFHELMVLTYQLIFLKTQTEDIMEKLSKGGFDEATVRIETTISPKDIMQPSTVKVLLQKIEFSPIPSEAI